jgi:hypothetical protein
MFAHSWMFNDGWFYPLGATSMVFEYIMQFLMNSQLQILGILNRSNRRLHLTAFSW